MMGLLLIVENCDHRCGKEAQRRLGPGVEDEVRRGGQNGWCNVILGFVGPLIRHLGLVC